VTDIILTEWYDPPSQYTLDWRGNTLTPPDGVDPGSRRHFTNNPSRNGRSLRPAFVLHGRQADAAFARRQDAIVDLGFADAERGSVDLGPAEWIITKND